jgi:hypothetical protein
MRPISTEKPDSGGCDVYVNGYVTGCMYMRHTITLEGGDVMYVSDHDET